ncbi:MAG: endonuclease III [Armatimonadetes bacterium]|nr:endonuclease III [Armatimonadota bacterium]
MREKAGRVLGLLEQAYGRPQLRGKRDPLDQLVLTVLSQSTSDVNSVRAHAALRARYPTWEAVLAAPEAEVARTIRPGGLAGVKAGRIQCILSEILQREGRLDLTFLNDVPSEPARAYLVTLPGVGPKTAACVLLFALGRPVLPVDTHVHRVSRRLGLIGATTSAEKAHSELQALLSEEQVFAFHLNLITHGRRVCRALSPCCDGCSLRPECAYRSADEYRVR